MELYLLRHGIAVERGAHNLREDRHRPLTPDGLKRTRKVAQALKAMKLKPDLVLTSPYVRAKQTADLVVEELEIPEKLRLCNALLPGGSPRDLVTDLKRRVKGDATLLLVGHEPGLSHLASVLVSGGPEADLTLKKAGLCLLRARRLVAGRCASLELLLSPKLLLRLAR